MKLLIQPRISITLLLLLSSLFSFSQTGVLRGFIYDKATGEPVSYANVIIKETDHGAAADKTGYFQIASIKPGTYSVQVSFVGYETIVEEVTIKAGENLTKKFFISEGVQLEEFTIDAERSENLTTIKVSVIKATPKDIKIVPTVGGESDLATYLQTLPGFVTTGDQGGQLYVRGGAPIQNKVLLDGMTIYNPFHSIGFFSVFDTDIIANADIYSGGFNAEYGGRISSVMDITTRDGNKNKFNGKVSASPFGAKLTLEGPIKKPKKEGGSSITYLLSGKTSYLAQTSKIFYNYVNEDSLGLPFNFTDLYGKIAMNGTNGSKLNLFGFRFTDDVTYQAISDLSWDSWGAGANFVLVPEGNPVLISGDVSFSHYGITLDDRNSQLRFSEVDGFNLGFDFKYFLKRDEIKYGIEVEGFRTNFQTYNVLNRKITQEANTTQLGVFVSYKLSRGRLLFEPSFRVQYYASLSSKFSPEPRFGLKFNQTERLRWKMAGGLYSQNLIAANSDRDVVNLFYGFLSGSDDIPQQYVNENGEVVDRKHVLQKAIHLIAGFELDITKKISINIEGYLKDYTQLTNTNRNKIYEADDATKPDLLKKDYIIETGLARGLDFVGKFTGKHTYVWVTYSLGKVDRWDGIQTYAPIFDRRHTINILFTQLFGKDDCWEVNTRWNFGSGLPFTQTGGYYAPVSFDNTNSDYTTSNSDALGIIYGDLNGGRLSTYHRFDVSLKRRFEFSRTFHGEEGKPDTKKITSKLEIILGVTNAYNRENIFYVDRISSDRVYQLPIIPTLGFNWAF